MTRCKTCGNPMYDGYFLVGDWYCSIPCANDETSGNKTAFQELKENGPSDEAYWSIVEDDEYHDEEEFEEDEEFEDDEY